MTGGPRENLPENIFTLGTPEALTEEVLEGLREQFINEGSDAFSTSLAQQALAAKIELDSTKALVRTIGIHVHQQMAVPVCTAVAALAFSPCLLCPAHAQFGRCFQHSSRFIG